MSRLTSMPVAIPKGVDVNVSGQSVSVKGSKGSLEHMMHNAVEMAEEDGNLSFRGVEGCGQRRRACRHDTSFGQEHVDGC